MYIFFNFFLFLIVTSTDCPDLTWPFYSVKPWRPNVNCTLIFSSDVLMSIEDFHLDESSCDYDYIFFQNHNYCNNFLPNKTEFIIPANEPIIIFSDSILVSEFASGLQLNFAINDVDGGQLETQTATNPSTTVNLTPSSLLTTQTAKTSSSLDPITFITNSIETTTTNHSPSIIENNSLSSLPSSTIISQTIKTTTSIQSFSSPSKAPTTVTTTPPSIIENTIDNDYPSNNIDTTSSSFFSSDIHLLTTIFATPIIPITTTLEKMEPSSTTLEINNHINSEQENLAQDFSTTPPSTTQSINNLETTTQSTKLFPDNTFFSPSFSTISPLFSTTSTLPLFSSIILDSDATTNFPSQILSTTKTTHTTNNVDLLSSKLGANASTENKDVPMTIMIYSTICFAVFSVCFVIIRCSFPLVKDYIWPREFTIEDYLSKQEEEEEEEDSELRSEFGGNEENSSSMIDIVRHSSVKRRQDLPVSEAQHAGIRGGPKIVYFEPYLIESHRPSLPRSSPSQQIGEKHWIMEDDEEIVSIAGTHDPLEGYENYMNFHGLDQLYAPPPRIEEDLISFADTESTMSEELRKSYIAPPVFDEKRRSHSSSVKSQSPEPSLVQNIRPYRSPDADLFDDEELPMKRQISDRSLSKRTADTASTHQERGERHPVRRVKRRVVRTRDPNNHERIIE